MIFQKVKLLGFMFSSSLTVANNNSANGFENRKFPLGSVVFPLSGEMVLRIYNTLILLSSLVILLLTEMKSVFSQDTSGLPRRQLGLCLAALLGMLWEHNGYFPSLMGTNWNVSYLITAESLTLASYLRVLKSLKL